MLFEEVLPLLHSIPTNVTTRTYSQSPQGGRCLFPTHSSSAAGSAQPTGARLPGQAKSGVRRPARLARKAFRDSCGLGLGGLGSGSDAPAVACPPPPLREEARAERAGEAPRRLPPISRGLIRASSQAARPCLTGCLRVPPALPTRSVRLTPPPALSASRAAALPVPSAPPRPSAGYFLGAGGGSGTGTKGLTQGSSRRGGIRAEPRRGAEAASAKKNVRLRRPTSSIRGDRQPAPGGRGGQARSRLPGPDPSSRWAK